MTIIGLALWFIVGGFLGLVIGGTIGYFTNSKTGVLTGLGIAFLFPTSILALMTYSNRVQTPQDHWKAEFKEIPPQEIDFVTADAVFSSDFYGRIFLFHADQETIETFTDRQGFNFLVNKKTIEHPWASEFNWSSSNVSNYKNFPSKTCPDLQEYKALDYFERSGSSWADKMCGYDIALPHMRP